MAAPARMASAQRDPPTTLRIRRVTLQCWSSPVRIAYTRGDDDHEQAVGQAWALSIEVAADNRGQYGHADDDRNDDGESELHLGLPTRSTRSAPHSVSAS